MKRLRLVALMTGAKKDGSAWYKATLKGKTKDGKLILKDFWLSADVGATAVSAGLLEDVVVFVECDIDERLNPQISRISAVTKTTV